MELNTNSKEEIFKTFSAQLTELFDIDSNKITLSSHVYEDLGLDSIDAIDIIIKLQEYTGKRVNPEDFKNARTVSDIVEAVYKLVNE